jgi:hypothetical protein
VLKHIAHTLRRIANRLDPPDHDIKRMAAYYVDQYLDPRGTTNT